jgi:hypothetical protein
VFVVTREPSGLPGETKITIPSGESIPLSELIRSALKEPENQLSIPLSRGPEFHPLFKPVEVKNFAPDRSMRSSQVRSVISGPRIGISFYRVRTAGGKEVVCDGQRALYVAMASGASRLTRVDHLKPGAKVMVQDGEKVKSDPIIEVNRIPA